MFFTVCVSSAWNKVLVFSGAWKRKCSIFSHYISAETALNPGNDSKKSGAKGNSWSGMG